MNLYYLIFLGLIINIGNNGDDLKNHSCYCLRYIQILQNLKKGNATITLQYYNEESNFFKSSYVTLTIKIEKTAQFLKLNNIFNQDNAGIKQFYFKADAIRVVIIARNELAYNVILNIINELKHKVPVLKEVLFCKYSVKELQKMQRMSMSKLLKQFCDKMKLIATILFWIVIEVIIVKNYFHQIIQNVQNYNN